MAIKNVVDKLQRRLDKLENMKRHSTPKEVIADTATAAAKTLTETATAAAALMGNDIAYIKRDISDIKSTLKELSFEYVTKDEFAPVKNLVFGLVSLILVAVFSALVGMVILKK